MSLQSLPTEILIQIFGYSDNLRTATNLSATNRRFHTIWTHYIQAIVRDITSVNHLYPHEANLLAELYEETDAKWHEEVLKCPHKISRAPDAVRRAITLTDERRTLGGFVWETIRHDQVHASVRHVLGSHCRLSSPLPQEFSDQPKALFKVLYQAVAMILSEALCDAAEASSGHATKFQRKVFQKMIMSDLKLLRLTLPSLTGCRNSMHQFAHIDLGFHFIPVAGCGEDRRPREGFKKLDGILSGLISNLARDAYQKIGADYANSFGDISEEKIRLWEDQVLDTKVEDQLALSSFCEIQGDRWVINPLP